ncbi:MAG: MarC family protein [Candidatus Thermoplasmatota archaeon]|nr:MarC family protein [Candidatus Thermoplasmatota archaeon]
MSSIIIQFLDIFAKFFVVIDPFGSLVLFIAMTGNIDQKRRRSITIDATLYGGLILIFFAIFGSYLLYFFGISIEALEIAGGLILLIMGIEMVREGDRPKSMGGGQTEQDIGIVPFATPFIAGPGAISLVIILIKGNVLANLTDTIFTLGSIIIVMGIIFLFFMYSTRITRLAGEKVLKALTRILGLLVAGIAIQYFINAFALMGVVP